MAREKSVEERIALLQATVAVVKKSLDELLDELQPLQTREYAEEIEVQANGSGTVSFGSAERPIPGSEVMGIPESVLTESGMAHIFHLEHLVVEDEDASYFDIGGVYIGQTAVWKVFRHIPASRFAVSAPRPLFNKVVERNQIVTVQVANKTNEARKFRAKLVGQERAPRKKESL